MKMPAMQFYPADWRKDLSVQALDFFERGIWFEMICLMHESSERGVLMLNGNPMKEDVIAQILGLDNQIFNQTLSKLLSYGVAKRREEDGAIFNKRMVDDEKICKIRREAGKKGGNPALLNQNLTTEDKQILTPSSSSSSSSSSSINNKPPSSSTPSKKVLAIFDYWKDLMSSPRSALDSKRKGLIEKALKNYSPEDICLAILGCSKSTYHMGDNEKATKYNGLDLILRSADKIDSFIALSGGAGAPEKRDWV